MIMPRIKEYACLMVELSVATARLLETMMIRHASILNKPFDGGGLVGWANGLHERATVGIHKVVVVPADRIRNRLLLRIY